MDFEEASEEVTEKPPIVWVPVEPARSRSNYWVKDADRHYAKTFGRLLSECGIIRSEWMALQQLYGPRWWSPVELGKVLGMSKGGASKLVTRLVKKGLVDKRKSDSDLRFRSVGLTAQGREFVVRLAPMEKDVDRAFFKPLGNTRRFRLTAWMQRLLETGHLQRMHQWMSAQLKQHEIIRVDPDARAKADAEARAKAEALWDYFKRVGEAVAYGRPPPPMLLQG